MDDQPEVLDSVLRDLRPLNSCFRLEGVESASECRELLAVLFGEAAHVEVVINGAQTAAEASKFLCRHVFSR